MIRPIRLKSSFNLFAPLALVAVANAAPQGNKLVPMPNTVLPLLVKSMPTVSLGPATQIEVAINLKPQNPAGLQAFVDAVSDPNSPTYGQFISPEEVGSRFGASVRDVIATKSFLASGGLTITHVGKNNMTIAATGTRSQIEALFETTIGDFQVVDKTGTVNFRANSTPLNVPATLVNKIQSINGVESYSRPIPLTTALTPPLTRTLYGLAPMFSAGFKGQGRTVGISNWDGFRLSNGNLYITQYGLPVPAGGPMSNVTVVPVGAGSGSGPAAGEGDLDFQMVLGVAPLANIIIYDGTGGNLSTVLSTEASANAADIITESYGWIQDANSALADHNIHLAMSAQGITYMNATGDSGTALEPFDYPDFEPESLGVGGTDATTDGAGNRITEPNWDGGGGGWSSSAAAFASPFAVRPSWQVGNGVPSAAIVNRRLVPDVALHATDYNIFVGGSLVGIGGTSAASPTWAGGLAVVEQKLFAKTGKARQGRIANKLYALNGKASVWFDVTTGPGIGNLPSTGGGSLDGTPANPGPGWDFATGWGAVNFSGLYTALVASSAPPTPVYAQGVSPIAGTVVSGDKASLNATDNNQYNMRSQSVKGLGQVAGFNALYIVPFTNIAALQVNLALNGPNGSSAIVSLQNVNTGAYDPISSVGLTGTTQTKTINFTSDQIAAYVQSNGTISLIIRAVMPSHVGQVPAPFTFSSDRASFAAVPTS